MGTRARSAARSLALGRSPRDNGRILNDDPRDIEIATGPGWRLTAHVEDDVVVQRLAVRRGASSKRSRLGADEPFAGTTLDCGAIAGPHLPFHVSGVVSKAVATIHVELNDGSALDADVFMPAGFDVGFYVAVVPFGRRPVAVLALDPADNELERCDMTAALDEDIADPEPEEAESE